MAPKDNSEDRTARIPPDEPEEKVGYGRPPRRHQFKKGTSGNPRGRRKGVKNEATMLREILHRLIPITQNGSRMRVPVMQGMLLRFADEALRGDTKAAAFLLNRYAAVGDPADDIDDSEKFRITDAISDEEASERYARLIAQARRETGNRARTK